MVKSMTGYGRAECMIGSDKYTAEIRSVNGKSADISIKTALVPREKEVEVRNYIASRLSRGNIDLFVGVRKAAAGTTAGTAAESAAQTRTINIEAVKSYAEQLRAAAYESRLTVPDEALLPIIMKMPDVLADQQESDGTMPEEDWQKLFACIREAVDGLDAFRAREGASLRADLLKQVDKIESYVSEVEKYEKERIEAVRERILSRIAELGLQPDTERLEQEMIFYIEKLDINEEKVRLRQHCRYFRETLDGEDTPGKKIGFIAQEMGREINTTGSKANHAEIQKWVVKMKDELEKIKEQSLNVL